MAKQDTINLIEEFTEQQKNNDFIILTTFAFDPYFFDKYLYHKIRANNPNAEIIVLVDGLQYVKSEEKFTGGTGRHYHLVPIYPNQGVFHPKVFLFLSKNQKNSTLFIGSANLTMQGFTKNVELITKISSIDEVQNNNFVTIREFFDSLISDGYLLETQVVKILKNALTILPEKPDNNQNPNCVVIHNMKSPITSQMIKEINDEKFSSATLIAPFYSNDPGLVEFLNSNLKIRKFNLCLQKNNHNLVNPQSYIDYFSQTGVLFEVNETKFTEDESRTIHSKILHLDGPKEFLLMGSPNMTRYALLMNASHGNIECSVFFKDIPATSLINDLDIEATSDFDELVKSGKTIESDTEEMNILKIFSVDFDDITRRLVILTEVKMQIAEVHVEIEGCEFSIDESHSLATGKIAIEKIAKGNPIEVVISCDGKIGRRRIYYDRGAFIRNISRSPESLNQLFQKLSSDFSLDTSDIHAIILGLSRPQTDDSDDNSSSFQDQDQHSQKSRDSFPKPSKINHAQNISSSLQRLNRAYHAILTFRLQEYQSENEDAEDSEADNIEKQHETEHSETSFRNELTNFINLFNQLLLFRVAISTGRRGDALVSSQGIFVDMILRAFPQNLEDRHLTQIETIISENLKIAIRENCESKTRIYLFESLLALNITYDLQMHPGFLNKLFHYEDFLNQDFYFRIKEFVRQSLGNDGNREKEFENEQFKDQFCSLMCYVFSSKTIGQGPVEVIRNMKSGVNEEYIDFLGGTLLKLKNGAWDSHRGGFSLNTPQKNIREDKSLTNHSSPKIKRYIDDFLN